MALQPGQQQDPTFTQLPPGLDPSNLMRFIQQANDEANRQRGAQQQDLDASGQPKQQPQQPPQPPQQADASQDDLVDRPQDSARAATQDDLVDRPQDSARVGQQDDLVDRPQSKFNPLTGAEIVPHLQQENEPYMRAQARPHGEWGNPGWAINAFDYNPGMMFSRFMPNPMEAFTLIRGGGARMAQYGAPAYGQPYGQASALAASLAPYLDSISGGRFSANFNKARMGLIKSQREEMQLHLEQGLYEHAKFLNGASGILDFYDFGGTSKEDAERQFENYLRENNHQNLINMLHSRGMSGVVDYLKEEDRSYHDMLSAHTTLRKTTGKDGAEADAAWDAGADDAKGGGARGDSPEARRTAASTFGPEKAPEAPATPAVSADADVDAQMQKQLGLNSHDRAAARQIANGDTPDGLKELTKKKQELIKSGAGIIEQGMDQAIHGPGSPDEKIERLEKVSPDAADELRGWLDYSLNPKDVSITKGRREKMERMARTINPNWKSNGFQIAEQYSKVNNQAVLVSRRVSSFLPAFNELNDALGDIDPNASPLRNRINKMIANNFTGDEKYARVYNAIVNVIGETQAIRSGTGRVSVSLARDQAAHMLETASPAQIGVQLMGDARTAYGQVMSIKSAFKSAMGDTNAYAPFYTKDTDKALRAALRTNILTGQVPTDAPGSVRAGQRPFDPKHRPSWMTDEQALRPLTEDEVIKTRAQIKKFETSPDHDDAVAVQAMRRRLGIFASPEPGDPDYVAPK